VLCELWRRAAFASSRGQATFYGGRKGLLQCPPRDGGMQHPALRRAQVPGLRMGALELLG